MRVGWHSPFKINVSYLEPFYQTISHGYWKCEVWNIFTFYLNSNIQNFFYFSRGVFTKHPAGLDRAKFGLYRFQFFLFFVVIVISIILKAALWQTLIHSQSLVKILWRSDRDKITFKVIEKHRYGLLKTVSKHLKYVENLLTAFFLALIC